MIQFYQTLILKLISLYFVLQKCSSLYRALIVAVAVITFELISWKFCLSFLKKFVLILMIITVSLATVICIERYQFKKELDIRLSDPAMDELKELYRAYKHMHISSEVYTMMSQLAALNDDDNDNTVQNILERINTMLDNPFLVEADIGALCMTRQVIIDMIKDSISDEQDRDDLLLSVQSIQVNMYIEDILRQGARASIEIEFVRVLMEKGSLAAMDLLGSLLTTKEGFLQLKQFVSTQRLDVEMLSLIILLENQEIFETLVPSLLELKIRLLNFLKQKYVVDCIQNYSINYVPKLVQTLEGRQQIVQDLKLFNRVMNVYIDALGNIIEESGNHKLSTQQVIDRIKVCTLDEIYTQLKMIGGQ
jgi:hypothetical protein